VLLVVNKKYKSDDNEWLGMKKWKSWGKRRRKKKQKKVDNVQNNIRHSVDTIKQFTEVNVGAPYYVNQVANTIK